MNKFNIYLTFSLLSSVLHVSGQVYQPFINDSFEGYSGGLAGNATGSLWNTFCLSGNCYNNWKIDSTCIISGNKSVVLTSHLLTDCGYDDANYSNPGNIILYSKKVKLYPRFKNVSLVFNWKAGGSSYDYGMVAYSLNGDYTQISDWTNVTNVYDGTAYGKYYNRSTVQYSSSNMKEISGGDSVRIAFRWITNMDGGVTLPGWIIDNVVFCALGEITSSLGDTLASGVMSRLTLAGYTGTVIQWERYSGGQWIYLAGNTDTYTTPLNLPDGENKFRIRIQNGLQITYTEKTILIGSSMSIDQRLKENEPCLLYPNPCDGHIKVSNPSGQPAYFKLTDSKGSFIYKFSINSGETSKDMNMCFLPEGIYFYFVKTNNTFQKNKLIILK